MTANRAMMRKDKLFEEALMSARCVIMRDVTRAKPRCKTATDDRTMRDMF